MYDRRVFRCAVWALAVLAAVGCDRPAPPAVAGPGAPPYPPTLARRLAGALAARGTGYVPRTRHRTPEGAPLYSNRLLLEASPYLQQHAHNPVDWNPWGDEAFARAAREGKPVLLSVGYATCHWCHVMEEESFEDLEIATLMNTRYVAIKVDREERPDVDGAYMAAVQAFTGGGGWPMTVWLTPERKPFFGGTYFPPRDGVRGVRTGFTTLLRTLADEYAKDPGAAAAHAAEVAARLADEAPVPGAQLPGAATLHAAMADLRSGFDATWGGFGRAPKFPRPSVLGLLLRYHRRSGEPSALAMVVTTLERMAAGGIHDQLGGGFHRYSTDARWLVPHFEKMLYDNALLAIAYLEAFQTTGREDFAAVARETLDYMARDLAAPGGGFFSATDADSDGEEGAYFVWTAGEIDAALGPEQGALVRAFYGVTVDGNAGKGRNVLWRPATLEAAASAAGVAPAAMESAVAAARPRLLAARATRVPPSTDHNVLVDWTALAVSAFARGAAVLGEVRYRDVAVAGATFLLAHGREGGRLRHSIGKDRPPDEGFLDDHAFLIAALLDVFEADGDAGWLDAAIRLEREMTEGFADVERGGFFFTTTHHEALLRRDKPDYDGAVPAGNSIAALDLLRLAELTAEDDYRERGASVLRAFGEQLARGPLGLPAMLAAVDFAIDRPKEVVVTVPAHGDASALQTVLARVFLPSAVRAVVRAGANQDAVARLAPIVAEKVVIDGHATGYVCEHRRCDLPTSDPQVFERQLRSIMALPPA